MEMNVALDLKQGLSLSPQMLQSIEILQMSSVALVEYVQTLSESNPIMDIEEDTREQTEYTLLKKRLDWLASSDDQNKAFYKSDSGTDSRDISTYGDVSEESLLDHIKSQINLADISPGVKKAALFIAWCMDGNGYVKDTPEEIAKSAGVSLISVKRALKAVQAMEPAGIGASSLRECLKLQLDRIGCSNRLAYDIVAGHLKSLGKNQYGSICKALKAGYAEVLEACETVRSLNPHPGAGFPDRSNPVYINPDIIVVKSGDSFMILPDDHYFPKININNYYKTMLVNTDEQEVREYLSGKIKQVNWVVKCIEQRKSTLLECVQKIVETQDAFFRFGPGHLFPMTLSDIAEQVNLHESTVSRTIREKYLQCSWGVYALNYFFSRVVSGEGGTSYSSDMIKSWIKRLISNEDGKKPLSDCKISEFLLTQGIEVSRRTVAKYRDELLIPSSSGRKKK